MAYFLCFVNPYIDRVRQITLDDGVIGTGSYVVCIDITINILIESGPNSGKYFDSDWDMVTDKMLIYDIPYVLVYDGFSFLGSCHSQPVYPYNGYYYYYFYDNGNLLRTPV